MGRIGDILRKAPAARARHPALGTRQLAIGNRQSLRRRAAGFTLIEAALTTVIIGTGVLSIVAAQQAYLRKNDWAQRSGTAMLLANELRELMLTLPLHDPLTGTANLGPEPGETGIADYNDLDDFAGPVDDSGHGPGVVFDPPVNALRQTVADLRGWSQHVNVASVLDNNISSTFTQPLGTTTLMRVTVTVRYQGPQDTDPAVLAQTTWVQGR